MSMINLVYADQASAMTALAALGLSAKDKDGNAILPCTTAASDGSRVDIIVAGGGSGIISKPTGATQPGPPLPGSSQSGPPIPVYEALPGFHLSVNWSGANPPDFGAAVTTDFDTAFVAAGAPASEPAPKTISDRQFAQQAASQGLITQDEALAWVGPGTIPATLLALVDELPAEQQFAAKIMLTGATSFDIDNPVTEQLIAAFGWTDAQRDAFWTAAAKL